jgi:glycosidase
MQWTRGSNAGFTSATPWEPLQADTATVNVAAQDRAGSLLDLTRRLIHLRAQNRALSIGRLIPVTASDEHVAAYVRRDGASAVLVVANLGREAMSGATLSADAGALPAGRYRPSSLIGRAGAAPLTVSADGSVSGYVPAPALAPGEIRILQLDRAR